MSGCNSQPSAVAIIGRKGRLTEQIFPSPHSTNSFVEQSKFIFFGGWEVVILIFTSVLVPAYSKTNKTTQIH